ncbi:hypothetical protein M0R45_025442 [Rubus argutus]|uniref:Uncharacterized protein n=1 Tax=Rubus argutus TaxID=59490 RepID=A0AAW1WU67_RUBAR
MAIPISAHPNPCFAQITFTACDSLPCRASLCTTELLCLNSSGPRLHFRQPRHKIEPVLNPSTKPPAPLITEATAAVFHSPPCSPTNPAPPASQPAPLSVIA